MVELASSLFASIIPMLVELFGFLRPAWQQTATAAHITKYETEINLIRYWRFKLSGCIYNGIPSTYNSAKKVSSHLIHVCWATNLKRRTNRENTGKKANSKADPRGENPPSTQLEN